MTETTISPAELSALIGAIYDCALDPSGWPTVLDALCRVSGSYNAIFAVQTQPTGRFILGATSNVDDAHLARLPDYGADILDQWGGVESFRSQPLEEPAVLSWLHPRAFMDDNRYFSEWAKPQGISDVIGFLVARDEEAFGTVGLGWSSAAGPITTSTVDLVRLIIPHFQRAVGISRILDLKTIVARDFEASLDAVPSGIVLVDAALRIVHANRAASAMLSTGGLISSVAGVLDVSFAPARRALADTVGQADADETLLGRLGFGIPIRSEAGEIAVLNVLPLKQGSLRHGLVSSAVAAILVAPAATPRPAPDQTLAALFDLTPTEARIFRLIGSGKTLAETATVLGIAASTARTHLLHIFAKTGRHRQADLVRLALSLESVA